MLPALQLRSGHKLSRHAKHICGNFRGMNCAIFLYDNFILVVGLKIVNIFLPDTDISYLLSVAAGGGKVIGTFCAVFGVLVIGLPIPIIGKSFNNFYAREKRREKLVLERAREEATSRAVTAQVNRAAN